MPYQNLDGPPRRFTMRELLKWRLERRPRGGPEAPAPRVPNDGTALRGAVRPSLTWIGHATFLVQLGGRSILTDPILSPRLAVIPREVPPGLAWDALPPIDLVVVSHNHYDHLDAPTVTQLGPDVDFVVPEGLGAWFRKRGLLRVTELAWWQTSTVRGVEVQLVPSQHWSRRHLTDTNESHWGGYVLAGGGARVYHSGDTAYFPGFAEIGRRAGTIDAAMLPIGAYAPRWFMKPQHMDPDDAVQAFCDLGAQRFVAMHWGTFRLTDEPLGEPPLRLRARWAEQGLDPGRLSVPAVGETIWL